MAMLLPLDESVWILMLILLMLRRAISKLLMRSTSVAPVLMAYSSALVQGLESASVACVLRPYLTVVPRIVMGNPVVDLLGVRCRTSCPIAVYENVEVRNRLCLNRHCWSNEWFAGRCNALASPFVIVA